MKAEWKPITIRGHQYAFVAIVNGREIGTIAKYSRQDSWTVQAGIGEQSKLIGRCYDKAGAKRMLLNAPESYWR